MYSSSDVSRLLLCAFIAGQVDFQKRINGMPTTQFDHARLDFLSLVIWSRVVWVSVKRNLRKARRWSKRVSPHSITFDYYSVLLVNTTMSARKSKLQVKLPLIKTTKRNIKTVFFLASLIVLRTNWTHNFKVFLTLKQWFTFQILAMCDEK